MKQETEQYQQHKTVVEKKKQEKKIKETKCPVLGQSKQTLLHNYCYVHPKHFYLLCVMLYHLILDIFTTILFDLWERSEIQDLPVH